MDNKTREYLKHIRQKHLTLGKKGFVELTNSGFYCSYCGKDKDVRYIKVQDSQMQKVGVLYVCEQCELFHQQFLFNFFVLNMQYQQAYLQSKTKTISKSDKSLLNEYFGIWRPSIYG